MSQDFPAIFVAFLHNVQPHTIGCWQSLIDKFEAQTFLFVIIIIATKHPTKLFQFTNIWLTTKRDLLIKLFTVSLWFLFFFCGYVVFLAFSNWKPLMEWAIQCESNTLCAWSKHADYFADFIIISDSKAFRKRKLPYAMWSIWQRCPFYTNVSTASVKGHSHYAHRNGLDRDWVWQVLVHLSNFLLN